MGRFEVTCYDQRLTLPLTPTERGGDRIRIPVDVNIRFVATGADFHPPNLTRMDGS